LSCPCSGTPACVTTASRPLALSPPLSKSYTLISEGVLYCSSYRKLHFVKVANPSPSRHPHAPFPSLRPSTCTSRAPALAVAATSASAVASFSFLIAIIRLVLPSCPFAYHGGYWQGLKGMTCACHAILEARKAPCPCACACCAPFHLISGLGLGARSYKLLHHVRLPLLTGAQQLRW
jgi:hypothetical protein